MGRPKKPISREQVEVLAEKMWTNEEIAAWFGVHVKTIERRFALTLKAGRHGGRAKLRDLLWDRAINRGSDRILIHVAERYLGPVKQEITHSGKLTLEELVAGTAKD